MTRDDEVRAMDIAVKLVLGVFVVFATGFVAACLEGALSNWEDESDDPR